MDCYQNYLHISQTNASNSVAYTAMNTTYQTSSPYYTPNNNYQYSYNSTYYHNNGYYANSNYAPSANDSAYESQNETNPIPDYSCLINEHEIIYKQTTPETKLAATKRSRVNQVKNSQAQSLRCSFCGLEFESLAKRYMHEHRTHKQGRSDQCPLCCKSFLMLILT